MATRLDETVRHTIRENAAADVILRDGGTLRLRPPARGDTEALVRFFAELSDQSGRSRARGPYAEAESQRARWTKAPPAP